MRGVLEARHDRAEAFVILRLGGRGDAAKRAAMEASLEGDDLVAGAIAAKPHEFDRRLVGLGAGVAEEGLAAKRPLRKQLGPAALRLDVPGVGNMNQRGDLLLHGLDHRLGAVAEEVAAPAGKEIEVDVALGVPHP